ncbi:hypothetical protein Q5762_35830 [Streptomyces sp. P9(2023)]|uniref:hypothetical protein n=1 Tax=Streptomyces sp. P9(2023) TaxID=3064394 RepID=UPI0028F4578D|nr:hypothetical protein [Streptomyces sp. P9(2023)]MDT9693598.1 hypothetical protein [Streptomyces sp. P9(2023)]
MNDDWSMHLDSELDSRLQEFAAEVDPLVAPAGGVADVHLRAVRRRARRRAGAGAVAVAVALTTGWWLLPGPTDARLSAQPGPANGQLVAVASILPSPGADHGLAPRALLSPAALPWNATYRWRAVMTGDGATATLPSQGTHPCALVWFSGSSARDQIVRTYSGRGRATAQHRIVDFPTESEARRSVGEAAEALTRCGWHGSRTSGDGHGPDSPVVYDYALTGGSGAPLRVTLVQSDHRVAVLALGAAHSADPTHADPRTERCLGSTQNSPQAHC